MIAIDNDGKTQQQQQQQRTSIKTVQMSWKKNYVREAHFKCYQCEIQ